MPTVSIKILITLKHELGSFPGEAKLNAGLQSIRHRGRISAICVVHSNSYGSKPRQHFTQSHSAKQTTIMMNGLNF